MTVPFFTVLRSITAPLLIVVALAGVASAQDEAVEYFGIPGPITFNGSLYELAWSSNPSPDYFKQEYVPDGQAVETYNDMVMIDVLTGAITPQAAADEQMAALNARAGTDPMLGMELIENPTTGELLLDFVLSDTDEAGNLIVEWNAYRYTPLEGGGLMLFAISHRAYGDEQANTFLGVLGEMRSTEIGELAGMTVPTPIF